MTGHVRDVMTTTGWIDGGGSVTAAAQQLVAAGASALTVCGPGRRFLGVLSDRDIVKWCTAEGLNPVLVRAGSLLDPADPQHVIHHDQPVDDRVLHHDAFPARSRSRRVGAGGAGGFGRIRR
jgi:CBS domain-containing protein